MPFLSDYPQFAIIQKIARAKKVRVYLVGGFLRDVFLQKPCLDYDFAVQKGAIVFAREFAKIGKEYRLRRFINLSVNAFVPKPFTPFQWQGMEDLKTLRQKLDFLKINLDKRFINLKWNNLELSFVEGALARGDRKIGQAILEAYRRGACFDGWDEEFNPEA